MNTIVPWWGRDMKPPSPAQHGGGQATVGPGPTHAMRSPTSGCRAWRPPGTGRGRSPVAATQPRWPEFCARWPKACWPSPGTFRSGRGVRRRSAQALVGAGLVGADALGCSLTVIGRHLTRAGDAPGGTVASTVQEAVAAGYVRALVTSHFRHDPLTGLADRPLFLDRLAAAVAAPAGRIGLCYVDLDGFTPINDTLGHDIGDRLLVAVAQRLEYRVTGLAATVARIGGDTFALLVEDLLAGDPGTGDPGGVGVMAALAGEES